jgi:hypothetical protein
VTASAFSQKTSKPLTKRVIVKTNLLSIITHRPTITIEKIFTKTFGIEASFVQGEFNNFLLTDHYDYNGFLVRAKKYVNNIGYGKLSPYVAAYVGNLKRNIQTQGQTDNTGFFSYPSRDFMSNSIRFGGSFGLLYVTKGRIIIDQQTSLGYGRYLNLDKSNPSTYSNGYLDVQMWLSVGYCF